MKYNTEIIYLVCKFPSIQCMTSLNRSTSTREVDGLTLISIDFYVPALTPLFYRSEAALQLSDNITSFALCGIYTRVIVQIVR
jgi:hypothetical protein